MIYFQNCSFGAEGWNTHVYSWTLCIALSNFLDRDFYFDYEVASPRPPEYILRPEFKERFGVIVDSPRSLVSDLMDIPNRRVDTVDRAVANKVGYQMLFSHFVTTEAIRQRLEGTMIWDSFAVGRVPIIREDLQRHELIEWTHSKLSSVAYFFFLEREEKAKLLKSVEIRYRREVEDLASKIVADIGPNYAVHSRHSDFDLYLEDGYTFNVESFQDYIGSIFPDRSLPVMIATDALYEKEMITRAFRGYQVHFIDELIFDSYKDSYLALDFHDYNVLTVLNQLICGAADRFIGTYRSTVTGIIHRLRQERLNDRTFYYWPEERIKKVLSADNTLTPDRAGFFDWNRFSVLSEAHPQMAWMREWDYELTAIDL